MTRNGGKMSNRKTKIVSEWKGAYAALRKAGAGKVSAAINTPFFWLVGYRHQQDLAAKMEEFND